MSIWEIILTVGVPLLWGSFCYYDGILCAGLGVIGLMVLLSALLPILNPGKYQKKNRD